MHRVRPARFLIFVSIWSVVVYDPVARWSWDPNGWSNKLGVMDFAGGTPVHIVSGTTIAAFAVFCSVERHDNFQGLVETTRNFVRKIFRTIMRLLLDIFQGIVGFGQNLRSVLFPKAIPRPRFTFGRRRGHRR